jgi:hypothetical protein
MHNYFARVVNNATYYSAYSNYNVHPGLPQKATKILVTSKHVEAMIVEPQACGFIMRVSRLKMDRFEGQSPYLL